MFNEWNIGHYWSQSAYFPNVLDFFLSLRLHPDSKSISYFHSRCDISPKPNPWDQNRRHFRRITRLAKIILLSRCLGHHCQSQSRPISSQLCKMFFTSCFPIDKLDGNCERKDLNEKHGVMFVNKASRSLIGQFRQGPLCRAIWLIKPNFGYRNHTCNKTRSRGGALVYARV